MALPTTSTQTSKGVPLVLYAGETLGQQGQGAAAAILLLPTGRRSTISQLLSGVSPTEAAYHALLIGLRKAHQLGITHVEIKGHNETVFNQINGLVEVREKALIPLHREALLLMRQFDRATVEWISQEQNRSACKAVQRCLTEALGHPQRSAHPRPPRPDVVRLMKLGDLATPADFQALNSDLDEFSLKSLNELRSLVPVGIQDVFALQWSGEEEELAQMYRWYLRGVPPSLAIKKVHLDRGHAPLPQVEKLPWEGQLKGHQWATGAYDTLNGEPFLEDGPGDGPGFASPIVPPLFSPLEEVDLPLEAVFALESPPRSSHSSQEADPFATANDGHYQERTKPSQDTLPSVDRVQQIMGMILRLSFDEQGRLVQELAQFPDLSNRFLTAIADRLKRP